MLLSSTVILMSALHFSAHSTHHVSYEQMYLRIHIDSASFNTLCQSEVPLWVTRNSIIFKYSSDFLYHATSIMVFHFSKSTNISQSPQKGGQINMPIILYILLPLFSVHWEMAAKSSFLKCQSCHSFIPAFWEHQLDIFSDGWLNDPLTTRSFLHETGFCLLLLPHSRIRLIWPLIY